MKQYLDLLRHVRHRGVKKFDRTGTGTLSVFGYQMRFDLSWDFPAVTTKKLHFKSIIHELLWFLRGESNIQYLRDNGVTIWDEWADDTGELGPVYGVQWRSWRTAEGEVIDQVANVVEQIKANPDSRRLIVSAWNPGEIEKMALAPCHVFFQFYVNNGALSCQMYQRSADVFLGVPFNIASYSLLTLMIARVTGLAPGEFVHTLGDAHLYLNHLEQADLQLGRDPLPPPQMKINPGVKIFLTSVTRTSSWSVTRHIRPSPPPSPFNQRHRLMTISLIVAMDRQDHPADAYFMNPGYRHSGECQNPVDKLSFHYKETFFDWMLAFQAV